MEHFYANWCSQRNNWLKLSAVTDQALKPCLYKRYCWLLCFVFLKWSNALSALSMCKYVFPSFKIFENKILLLLYIFRRGVKIEQMLQIQMPFHIKTLVFFLQISQTLFLEINPSLFLSVLARVLGLKPKRNWFLNLSQLNWSLCWFLMRMLCFKAFQHIEKKVLT